MRFNLNHLFKTHKLFILSTLAFILFTFLSVMGYMHFETTLIRFDSSSLKTVRPLVFGAIFIYGFTLLVILWFAAKTALRPTKKVLGFGHEIASEEMSALTNAIGELSQGDLSKQLQPKTKAISISKESELTPVINIFNAMSQNLNDAYQAFNNITGQPCKRLFYVGADSFLEGRRCGEMMGQCLNGNGRIILTAESFSNTNLDLRRRGFLSMLQEKYPGIEIVETLDATAAQGIAYKVGQEILKKHNNLTGIYVASGSSPSHFAKAVVEANKASQIKIVCHDLLDETMQYVKDGVITATLSQNSLAQGHDPVIHMFNHLAAGWKPLMPYLLTEMEIVTTENYRSFWKEGQGIILSGAAKNKLAKPLNTGSAKPLRIAVLGRDDTAFWQSIKKGVEEAKKTLEGYPVTIDWIVPDEVRKIHRLTAEIYGPAMERIKEDRYDGLVTMASDQAFIPYINNVVDSGIPVGLYNSDPTSLRGLIFTVSSQADHLMGLSENLASSTSQTNQATIQIRNAMEDVAQSTRSQNDEVLKTSTVLENLLVTIDFVRRDTEKSALETENTIKAVFTGVDAMNRTLTTMQTVEKSVINTWGIVEELSKHSDRIDTVVELINDIASRVNVLALNAAIEATKAGDFGVGFMVVAQEIRNLAKNTAVATKEVAQLISTVQIDISKVDRVMSEGLEKLKRTTEFTDDAKKAITDIQRRVEIDKQRILNIAKAMTEMQNSSLNVGQAMENVGTTSQKNMSAVEQVNDLTKDMTVQLEAVTNLAKSLEAMARGEQEMLAKFSLVGEN